MVDGVGRVELRNPDGGVIQAAEQDVERFLAAGWERVGGRRRADTGSQPTIDSRQARRAN